MRIIPITGYNITYRNEYKTGVTKDYTMKMPQSDFPDDISCDLYVQALMAKYITFGAYANSSGLKRLFSYGIPCMYSGIKMIDATKIRKLEQNGYFNGGIAKIVSVLEPYEESMLPIEKELFGYIKNVAETSPDKKFPELMSELEPEHFKKLRSQQAVTFFKLKELSKSFPPDKQEEFNLLMQNTDKKLSNAPVIVPFSSYEFQYKLQKLYDTVSEHGEADEIKTMRRLLHYASQLNNTTNSKTRNYQGHVLRMIKYKAGSSSLKNNQELKELLETSERRLYNMPVNTPFNRKSYLYDLMKITDGLEDETLKEQVFKTAEELPTSRNNLSAFILKFQNTPSTRLCYRLVSDSFGSIEHLLPQSKGGRDELANYGPASAYFNSQRGNVDFLDYFHEHPAIRQTCQYSVDKMIELANKGVFEKIKLPRKYIIWFSDTIARLTDNELVLNTSKLKLIDAKK